MGHQVKLLEEDASVVGLIEDAPVPAVGTRVASGNFLYEVLGILHDYTQRPIAVNVIVRRIRSEEEQAAHDQNIFDQFNDAGRIPGARSFRS